MLEKVANYGLTPNMAMYLMKKYHMKMTTASNILFYWSAATNFMPVIGAIIADSYVGRFTMIGFGSVVSLLVITSPVLEIYFLAYLSYLHTTYGAAVLVASS